ncbi:MAG: energy transducer TonB [Desulfuromonadaceae bacterium]
MKTNKISICLIGSAFIHLAIFITIAKMSPATHVSMRDIDTFIVGNPVQQLAKQKRTFHPGTETDTNKPTQEASPPQTAHEVRSPSSPQANHSLPATAKPAQSVSSTPPSNSSKTDQPAVRTGENSSASKLSNAAYQSSEAGQVMAFGQVGSPRFIHRETPKYPFMARKRGKEGKVVLKLTLDSQGQLLAVETVEANGFEFAEAANAAIRLSTYAPAVRNGKAVPSQVLIPIKFVLEESR